MNWLVLIVAVLLLSAILILEGYYELGCEQPIIPGIPRAGTKYPFVGSLFNLGKSQAQTYSRWADMTSKKVFQTRLGCKRIVVANDYSSVKELWVDNMTANCSRPISYTFHKVVSASQGYTIGTTPWGQTYKRKRKLAGVAMNKPAIKSYMPFIDKESGWCIDSMAVGEDMDVGQYFRTYALNCGLSVNYGTRLDGIDQQLLQEICTVEKCVGQFRASLHNWQDFLPILRWLPKRHNYAVEIRQRRDSYMNILLNTLRWQIDDGTAASCIAGNILQDPQSEISEADLKSVCLTMVSAGLDTVPATLIYFIGFMSQPSCKPIQDRAYSAIYDSYGDDIWTRCLDDDTQVEYIKAVMHETLRMSAMPISLPRETIRDIRFHDAIIPKGTRLIMNAYGANYDPKVYTHPERFDPDRYLKPNWQRKGPKHFAFGAGTRMCAGVNLAERQLYTAMCRLLARYEVFPPNNTNDLMPTDPALLFSEQTSLVVEPPPFKVRLERRRRTPTNTPL